METLFLVPQEPASVNAILLWGMEVIRAIQSLKSAGLITAMILVSDISIAVFVILVVLCYWCIDEKRGIRLGIIAIITGWLNLILKIFFKQPRPFNLDPSLGLAEAMDYGFGFPSGHTQISLTLIVILACWAAAKYSSKRILIWGVSIFLVLLIGFSRLYLGVHFPTDLAGGWLVGGITLAVFFLGGKKIADLLESSGKRAQLITSALAAFIMISVYKGDTSLPGLFLGTAGGYALLINSASFSARGMIGAKKPAVYVYILRCVLGIAGAAVIYYGFKFIFPGEGSVFEEVSWWGPASPYLELGRFIRYGLIGLWISVGAPLLFGNLNLAEIKMKNREGESN